MVNTTQYMLNIINLSKAPGRYNLPYLGEEFYRGTDYANVASMPYVARVNRSVADVFEKMVKVAEYTENFAEGVKKGVKEAFYKAVDAAKNQRDKIYGIVDDFRGRDYVSEVYEKINPYKLKIELYRKLQE